MLTILGVLKLATIRLNYASIDLTRFASKMINGRRMRRLSAQVTVQFGHRRGVLVFTATVNGVEVGSTEVTFDGQSTTDVAETLSNLDIRGNAGGQTSSCAPQ